MNHQYTAVAVNPDDYIDNTIFFGEMKKTILSKEFKGGKITNVFGSIKLDFTYADISGVVVLDISQVFGEVKLIVPENWRVEPDVSQFFATVTDKRIDMGQTRNTNKVLVLTGSNVMGEVKIKSSY